MVRTAPKSRSCTFASDVRVRFSSKLEMLSFLHDIKNDAYGRLVHTGHSVLPYQVMCNEGCIRFILRGGNPKMWRVMRSFIEHSITHTEKVYIKRRGGYMPADTRLWKLLQL
jgi:hypothetical protein